MRWLLFAPHFSLTHVLTIVVAADAMSGGRIGFGLAIVFVGGVVSGLFHPGDTERKG